MRRASALALSVLGYAAIAALSPAVAVPPALVAFGLGGWLLLTREDRLDPAEAIARELLER